MKYEELYEFVEERANSSRGFSGEDMLALSPHLQEYEYAPGSTFLVLNDCYWVNDYGDVCRACFIPWVDDPSKMNLKGLTLNGRWRGFHFRPMRESRYDRFNARYKKFFGDGMRTFYYGNELVGFIIGQDCGGEKLRGLRECYDIGEKMVPNMFYL